MTYEKNTLSYFFLCFCGDKNLRFEAKQMIFVFTIFGSIRERCQVLGIGPSCFDLLPFSTMQLCPLFEKYSCQHGKRNLHLLKIYNNFN